MAIRDRHSPRTTWYRVNGMKKGGGGRANWGRPEDFYDDTEIPLYTPFEDPELEAESEDNSKVRVSFVCFIMTKNS